MDQERMQLCYRDRPGKLVTGLLDRLRYIKDFDQALARQFNLITVFQIHHEQATNQPCIYPLAVDYVSLLP